MKAPFLIVFVFLISSSISAQDSTAAKEHARFWCDCIGKTDPTLPGDSIVQQVNLCESLSITHLLNNKFLTREALLDSAKQEELNAITVALMLRNCAVLNELLAPKEKVNYREENPDNIFTPASFFATYGLAAGETNARLRVYNMKDKENKYQRCVDIRWVFENNKDAISWYQVNLEKNAEGGEPVKENLAVADAEMLAVFRESKAAADMMKSFGMVQRHHYFIFITGNVVCKVFVATDGTVNTKDLLPFAEAAAKQVKANMPK
jgi:hypothetical protein